MNTTVALVRVVSYQRPQSGKQEWCALHPNAQAVAAIVSTRNGNLWNRPACEQCISSSR